VTSNGFPTSLALSISALLILSGCGGGSVEGDDDTTQDPSDDDSAGDDGVFELADADAKIVGEAVGDKASRALGAGDVDGDGYGDIVVGATGEDSAGEDAGAIYLLYGPLAGEIGLADADAKLTGEAADDEAGSVSEVGDMDGDGLADVFVGAFEHDAGESGSGAVYLVYEAVTGQGSLADADAKIVAGVEGDAIRRAVGAGDVDGDGLGDLLILSSTPIDFEDDPKVVHLLLGPIHGQESLGASSASIADPGGMVERCANPGDVDGDGFADVLLGAHWADGDEYESGVVYLFRGPLGGDMELSDAHAVISGDTEQGGTGKSLGRAGDIDGDGVEDILIASKGNQDHPLAGIVSFATTPLTGEVSVSDLGTQIVGEDYAQAGAVAAGDVNGDGHADILVGAPNNYFLEIGEAFVFFGPLEGTIGTAMADIRLVGETPGDSAGDVVASAGDVDADGLDDLLIGTWGLHSGVEEAGAAYLVYGASVAVTSGEQRVLTTPPSP